VLNNVTGPSDSAEGSFNVTGASGLTLSSGWTNDLLTGLAFSGLGAGDSFGGLSIALDTSTLGLFSYTILLDATGYNESGYSGALPQITLNITGDVTSGNAPVPEPGTLFLMGTGLAGLLGLRKKIRA
jgi:hypothetical protein